MSGGGKHGEDLPWTNAQVAIQTAQSIRNAERASAQQTQQQQYETTVNNYLDGLLVTYNDRNVEVINRHLSEIERTLSSEIEGVVSLVFAGSVARHTYIDGFSDIDVLVLLNNTELVSFTPTQVKDYFYQRLLQRFPSKKDDIRAGRLAITINYSDCDVQIVPSIKVGDHHKISNATGSDWMKVRPVKFAKKLSEVNQNIGKVVPTIKLAKSIIAQLPVNQQINGYHCEALAINIFKNYDGAKTTKAMLKYFFERASQAVLQSVKDSTNQTVHVDDYLGSSSNEKRKIISDSFLRIYRKMQNADGAKALDLWKGIVE